MGLKRQMKAKRPTVQRDECNRLIERMGNSMAWITLGVIESHAIDGNGKGFESIRKISNFYDFVLEEKKNWQVEDDTAEIVRIAKEERPYIYQGSRDITTSQYFLLAGLKQGTSTKNPNIKIYLQVGWIIIMLWTDEVLKKHYRMSVEARIDVMTWVIEWIRNHQAKLMSLESINDIFIEELGWDLATGEKVNA